MVQIFDIEVYSNYFGVQFKNVDTKEVKEFIIFEERNDFNELIDFITNPNMWLVGYNNFNFDNQLLNFMYKRQFGLGRESSTEVCAQVYELAKQIVTDRTFGDYKYRLPFRSLDLMKLGAFYKSLKLVGVNLKWNKLQDLPIKWESTITKQDLEVMHTYNLNDVLITEQLYYYLLPEIKMRYDISVKYGVDAYSESRSGLANRLLEKFYSESTGLEIREFKDLRTDRKRIPFSMIIYPDIKFDTPELNELLESLYGLTYFKATPFFKKSVLFGGIKYQMGLGGGHSKDQPAKYVADEKTKIIDCDVASMYAANIINNKVYPQHLGEIFLRKYTELRDLRLKAKRSKDTLTADALKIVILSTWGKFLSDKHWLCDQLAGLKLTINGQLYILMLIEQLVLNGFEVISVNTDGVVTLVPVEKEILYKEVCKKWETYTNFELEFTEYSKYIRRDVNNYVAIKTDGKTKEKGIFFIGQDLVKGFDKPIISIALYEYFVNGKKIEDTIRNHRDIYDFCIAQKSDDKFTNVFHYLKNNEKVIERLQKTVRFYISTNGGKLYKEDAEGKAIEFCVGKRITIFNDYVAGPYNIDYQYYIAEAYKILYLIENPQLTLF